MLKANLLASAMTSILLVGCVSTSAPTENELISEVAELKSSTASDKSGGRIQGNVDVAKGYEAAVAAAVRANPGFLAALSRVEELSSTVAVAQSAGRLQGTASATSGAVVETGSTSDTTVGIAGDVSLSKLLFDGGVTKSNVNAASARAFGARFSAEAIGNEVAVEAARAWVDLWQYSERIALLEGRLSELKPLTSQIESLKNSGLVDRTAVAEAEKQIINIQLEQASLGTRRVEAQARFDRYFAVKPSSVGKPKRMFTTGELAAMQSAIDDAPELQVAAAGVIASAYDLDAAKGRLKPTVALRSGVNSPLSASDNPDVSVGLVLQYQFGDGGRRKAEVASLESRLSSASDGLQEMRRAAQAEFTGAVSSSDALWKSRDLLVQQTELLKQQLETLRSQIGSGQSSIGNLVETEVEYYRTMSRLIEIDAEIMVIELGIAGKTGKLLPRLGVAVAR